MFPKLLSDQTVLGSLRNDGQTAPPRRLGLHCEMETKLISRIKKKNSGKERDEEKRDSEDERERGEKGGQKRIKQSEGKAQRTLIPEAVLTIKYKV